MSILKIPAVKAKTGRKSDVSINRQESPIPTAANTGIQPSTFDALPDIAYIREAHLVPSVKRPGAPVPLPFSSATLWRKVRAKTFPAPLKLGAKITAWKVGEVRAWLNAQSVA